MYPPTPAPAVPARTSAVSRALARDKLGVPSVWAFLMSGIAPLTVAAGVITTAYATTGLTSIPFAFVAVAVLLALCVPGYVAMARHIRNAGAFYAFVSKGLGRPLGVAAALMALLAYTYLQTGLYGAFGPAAQSEATAHLHLTAPWWAWALAAWTVVTVLGLARVEVTGKILGVLTTAEIIVITIEVISGLTHPSGGHLSLSPLSPASLGGTGWNTIGVLAVIAGLGYVGYEQAPVLGEETRNPRRTIPAATYLALTVIAVVYAGAAWAMAAHTGTSRVAAAAAAQGPGLLFGMSSTTVGQVAQVLYMTSLFAALLAFHNSCWRYIFSVSRERVLPAFLSATKVSGIPAAASLTQSATGLAVIVIYAAGGWQPMTNLFFWLGTTGGFGILLLLAVTSLAVIRYFARNPDQARSETAWARITAPAVAALALATISVLAVTHYATLLGVTPGNPATWLLPASYGAAAGTGLIWAAILRARRPDIYQQIGLGAHAATARLAAVQEGTS